MEFLVVTIDEAQFGLPTQEVREVLRAAWVAPAPGQVPALVGLLNLRGHVLPVLSLRTLLSGDARSIVPADHFVVVRGQSRHFVLHVDRVVDLLVLDVAGNEPADESKMPAMAHPELGVVQLFRADELWRQAGVDSREFMYEGSDRP